VILLKGFPEISLKMYLFISLKKSSANTVVTISYVTKSVYNSFPRLQEPSRELCYVNNRKAENKPKTEDGMKTESR